jgi:hypothetical protein
VSEVLDVTLVRTFRLEACDDWRVTMTGDQDRVQRRVVTTDELRADVDRVLAEEGLPFDRFVQLGKADELDNPRLRDLWLLAGAVLIGA